MIEDDIFIGTKKMTLVRDDKGMSKKKIAKKLKKTLDKNDKLVIIALLTNQ